MRATSQSLLEFGDRVGLLAHRNDFVAIRRFFGDSIKTTAEFSYISIGLGMAVGFLIGAIQLPIPGNFSCINSTALIGARARRRRNAATASTLNSGEPSAGAIFVHHEGGASPR